MDEEGFREFLRKSKQSGKTIKAYVSFVKKFEEYLSKFKEGKGLDEATPRGAKDFVLWGRQELKAVNPYLYGIQKYYEYKANEVMSNAIREIPRDKPQRSGGLISWDFFEKHMEKLHLKYRDSALLNLLWSEMDSNEILELSIADIDFKKRLITSRINGRTFYITKKAWDSLEKYIPIEDRDRRKPLFSINLRRLQQITKKYFESVSQTPIKLKLSCKKDLVEAGRKERFVTRPQKEIKSVSVNNDTKMD